MVLKTHPYDLLNLNYPFKVSKYIHVGGGGGNTST